MQRISPLHTTVHFHTQSHYFSVALVYGCSPKIGGKLHLFLDVKLSWRAPLTCLKVSSRSFYKMTHLYWRTFWKCWKVYYWLSCGVKGGKVLSADAELDSHSGNVIDRLKVRAHSSCFQAIFCWYIGNSSRNVFYMWFEENINRSMFKTVIFGDTNTTHHCYDLITEQ